MYERNYEIEKNEKFNQEIMEYWNCMLGQETIDWVLKSNPNFKGYLCQEDFEVESEGAVQKVNYFLEKSERQCAIEESLKISEDEIYFLQFYLNILDSSVTCLRERLKEKEQYFSNGIYKDFVLHLARQLQEICIRTLVVEIHVYKDRGKLKGSNTKEEYDYFCENIVGSREFMQKLFEQYPVLERCITERAMCLQDYYTEVIENFQKDKDLMSKVVCRGKKVNKIVSVIGSNSDLHHRGKQVLKILLDSGDRVLYKPRSMENEKVYEELLQHISESIGITQYQYPILTFGNHSWCTIVEYDCCHTRKQLEEYYRRLGVQLFLVYLLGTKDLHCENIIASGQYPVLIDLEALTHMQNNQSRNTAEQEVKYQISQSVLFTGLLPFYMWNQKEKGIDVSAINGMSGQEYPFEIPVVVKGRTSEMQITYKRPHSQKSYNQAKLEDKFIDPAEFETEIAEGFCKAYELVADQKEKFGKIIEEWEGIQSRILIADTQYYSMLLSASYHPELMRNGADREVFLYSLWRGKSEKDDAIVKAEVKDLLSGDVPYFYINGNDKGIYWKQTKVIADYFRYSAKEQILERLEKLCEVDKKKQSEYISVSLELSGDSRERCINRVYYGDVEKESETENGEELISKYTEKLLNNIVWNYNRTEVNWPIIKLPVRGTGWNVCSMDMYLYDGLAGMLLLFYALTLVDERKEICDIYSILRKQLFDYTEMGRISPDKLQTKNTGAYSGESSIVYTYILLYEWSHEVEYLEQAQKHADIVLKLLDTDVAYDIVSGNAGAAQVFLKLYNITLNSRYLNGAKEAVESMQRASVKMESGVGWKVDEKVPPMAGMAHGNSGILLPVAGLWKITGENKYQQLAKNIWLYEDSLFDEECSNWVDMRQTEKNTDKTGAVAWCHGAGGVLLSRIKCYRQVGELMDEVWKKEFKKDIERAYDKLNHYWRRDSWCLCHGSAGNLWILNIVDGKTRQINRNVRLLPQEKINPGMMNGYGGILYWLLKGGIATIPEIFI